MTFLLLLVLFMLLAAPDKSIASGKQFQTSPADGTTVMPFPASTRTPEHDEPASSEQSATDTAPSTDENGTTGMPDDDDVFDKMAQPETWSTEELVGYLASFLVVMTFCMREMWSLRVVAIGSNVAFIIYGYIAVLPPVFLLHLILLPINLVRILQLAGRSAVPLKRNTRDDNGEPTLRFRHYLFWRRYKMGAGGRETEPGYADATWHAGRQSTGTSATTADNTNDEYLHSASEDYRRLYPTDGIIFKH